MEEISVLNNRLKHHFGIDTVSSNPIWRLVWSEDELENRLTNYTKEGLQLLTPIVVTVPKYRQWVQDRYILERLTVVPEFQQDEIQSKISYEPVWVFEDRNKQYLPPIWDAIKVIIDSIYAATGKQSMAKYKETPTDIHKLVEDLFGNETDTGDALAQRDAIVVPGGMN